MKLTVHRCQKIFFASLHFCSEDVVCTVHVDNKHNIHGAFPLLYIVLLCSIIKYAVLICTFIILLVPCSFPDRRKLQMHKQDNE